VAEIDICLKLLEAMLMKVCRLLGKVSWRGVKYLGSW